MVIRLINFDDGYVDEKLPVFPLVSIQQPRDYTFGYWKAKKEFAFYVRSNKIIKENKNRVNTDKKRYSLYGITPAHEVYILNYKHKNYLPLPGVFGVSGIFRSANYIPAAYIAYKDLRRLFKKCQ